MKMMQRDSIIEYIGNNVLLSPNGEFIITSEGEYDANVIIFNNRDKRSENIENICNETSNGDLTVTNVLNLIEKRDETKILNTDTVNEGQLYPLAPVTQALPICADFNINAMDAEQLVLLFYFSMELFVFH